MRFVRMALVSFAALTIVSTAKADILLEPYAGMTFGTFEGKQTVGGSDKYDNNNLNVGARFGWQFLVVMAGVDYQMPLSGKLKGQSGLADADFTNNNLYAFVGARLPAIRAYAGYALQNDLKGTVNGSTVTYTGGSGLKLGVSFTALPLIAINAEYITNDYKKLNNGAEMDISAAGYSSVKNDYVMVSVSAPLSF